MLSFSFYYLTLHWDDSLVDLTRSASSWIQKYDKTLSPKKLPSKIYQEGSIPGISYDIWGVNDTFKFYNINSTETFL